jgi:hypothetical protein
MTSIKSNSDTANAVCGYTAGWMSGDLEAARSHLDPKVTFQDPVNRFDSADELIAALAGFRAIFKSATPIKAFYDEGSVSLLYDCAVNTPVGMLRCAEYFTVVGGKITDIKLVFDATEINKMMGK